MPRKAPRPAPPLNLSMFRKRRGGAPYLSTSVLITLANPIWISCLGAEGVYLVTIGAEDPSAVQIRPRWLCPCTEAGRSPEICNHIAAALIATGSEWIDEGTRARFREKITFDLAIPPPEMDRIEITSTRGTIQLGPKSASIRRHNAALAGAQANPNLVLDPESGFENWIAALELSHAERRCLMLVPEAISNPEIAVRLLDTMWARGGSRLAVKRWQKHAPESEFPNIFRRLGEIQEDAAAWLLEDEEWSHLIPLLQPKDLLGLLRSRHSGVREMARHALLKMNGGGGQSELLACDSLRAGSGGVLRA